MTIRKNKSWTRKVVNMASYEATKMLFDAYVAYKIGVGNSHNFQYIIGMNFYDLCLLPCAFFSEDEKADIIIAA